MAGWMRMKKVKNGRSRMDGGIEEIWRKDVEITVGSLVRWCEYLVE